MKKRLFSGLLALSLLVCAAPGAGAVRVSDFADVPLDHWAYPYVRACARAGIIAGVSGNGFAPDAAVTAEQFITLAGRACFESEARAAALGTDTWSGPYIRVARERGYLDNTGITELTEPVRRGDVAMLLYNLRNASRTADYGEAFAFCYGAGLLSGMEDGQLHGEEYLTRAQAAKVVALLAGLAFEPSAAGDMRFYVLMYHSVVPDGGGYVEDETGEFSITESDFRADLQWMADHGYTTVLPGELSAGWALPRRTVLITFDDGYANNYTAAFPLLKEYGAKAVISPVVRCVEEGEPNFLSWDMCREMLASGLVEFGSHTYNQHGQEDGVVYGISRRHGEPKGSYEVRIFSDIKTSVELLESNLGCKVSFFAYPYGLTDSWASAFLREHFTVTVTTRQRAAYLYEGLYELPRYNVNSGRPARSVLPA